VSEKEINEIKELHKTSKDSIILVPSFRSYIDFVILSYVHFYFDLDMPFVCGHPNFSNITLFSTMLRKSGAFFMTRDHGKAKSELFNTVNE
jgi:glycerol-3-phosphate O-acyltransferase